MNLGKKKNYTFIIQYVIVSAYRVPCIILGSGDKTVNKTYQQAFEGDGAGVSKLNITIWYWGNVKSYEKVNA